MTDRAHEALPRRHRMTSRVFVRLLVGALVLRMISSQRDDNQTDCTATRNLGKFPGGWPKTRDSSVYWFSAQDDTMKASGTASQYYDPTKPTLIFIQGWNGGAGGGVHKCRRWTSACTPGVCPDQRILSKPWVEGGWNFGIFYWDQFADEKCARDAEIKIWLSNATDRESLTWRSYDVQSKTESTEVLHGYPSVGHVCAESIRYALQDFRGPSIRLVGHSLGGQLAAHCAKLLHEQTPHHPARPSRLVLLDPFFTVRHFGMFRCSKIKVAKGYGRMFPLAVARIMKELWQRGVVSELYKGSALTLAPIYGDPAQELETLATFVQHTPSWCEARLLSGSCTHCALLPLYTQRIGETQPEVENGIPAGSCTVPGPSCTDDEIREFIVRQNSRVATKHRELFVQTGGGLTITTSDDTFKFVVEPAPTNSSLLGLDVHPDLHTVSPKLTPQYVPKVFEEPAPRVIEEPAPRVNVEPAPQVIEESPPQVIADSSLKTDSTPPQNRNRNYAWLAVSVSVLFMCCASAAIYVMLCRRKRLQYHTTAQDEEFESE